MASLFTSQTPAGTDNSDGSPGITTATTVRFAVAGTVTAIRFYATTTISGTYTGALWQVTGPDDAPAGTLLASKVRPTAPTGGTWNLITLDTPVAVTTGVLYRTGVHNDARYVNTASFFTTDLVNGDITADANGEDPVGLGTLGQGVFAVNASLTYPSTGFSSSSYFVDVDFTPDGAGVAVTGRCTAVASTTAITRKVSGVIAARSTAVAAARSTAVHVATPAARAVAVGTSRAVVVHRTPVVATSVAVAATTAGVVKLVAVSGRTVAVVTATSVVAQPGGPVAVVARCVAVAVCRCRIRLVTRRPNVGTTTRPFTGITYRP